MLSSWASGGLRDTVDAFRNGIIRDFANGFFTGERDMLRVAPVPRASPGLCDSASSRDSGCELASVSEHFDRFAADFE